jgi:hypothetical protein
MCLVEKSVQEGMIHLLPCHFSFVRVDNVLNKAYERLYCPARTRCSHLDDDYKR